jgi:POTRA domain, FtsQ-type
MTQRTSTSRASRSVGRSSAPTPLTRRSPPRRSKLRLGLVVLLVFALAAGAIWVVFWSSLLATRNVEVVGTSRLSTAEVMAAANVPLGQPLARLDTAEVRARVAELAPVESVDVARVLPGTVRLDVVERTPIAVLGPHDGDDEVTPHTVLVHPGLDVPELAQLSALQHGGDLLLGTLPRAGRGLLRRKGAGRKPSAPDVDIQAWKRTTPLRPTRARVHPTVWRLLLDHLSVICQSNHGTVSDIQRRWTAPNITALGL